MNKITDSSAIVGPVRLSYLNAFKPRKNKLKNDLLEYGAILLLPKGEATTNKGVVVPVNGKAEGGELNALIKNLWNSKYPAVTKWTNPLKDGDTELDDENKPRHPGYWYIRCTSEYAPVCIDCNQNYVVDGWESGDWAKVKINIFTYDQAGNKGVGCGLRGIQFLYKDEPLGASNNPDAIRKEFGVEKGELVGVAAAAVNTDETYDPFE